MPAMIEVEGLRRRYRTRRGPVEAVAGIDLRVEAGEFVGYAGPNGAGKSTTVKIMSGILLPSAGRVVVDGLVPYQERKRLARRIGVVFGQRSQLWWDLPLSDSFDLVRYLYRMPAATWRRRLDEPTIGLDIEAKAAVRGFVRHLNAADRTTIILTTHDLDDITELCDLLIIIDHGQIVYDGTIDELHTAYGSTRMLVVDLADPAATLTTGPDWAGAQVVRAEGHRRWIRFAREGISAAQLVALVLADHQVLDLSIVEPDIEDVIRRIYRGETRPPGTVPPP